MTALRAGACLTCRSISGEGPISPVAPVLLGDRWRVEHRAALHELDTEEWAELVAVSDRVRALLASSGGT